MQCYYKVITKVIANWLKPHLETLIDLVQCNFIPKLEDLATAPLNDVDLLQSVRSVSLDNGDWD